MMFTHVLLGSADVERSRAFFDATMTALGHDAAAAPAGAERIFYGNFVSGAFGVGTPVNGEPQTYANGGTVGLRAPSADAVDSWHAAGLANGGTCEGAPGPRQNGASYGAYLRDPDGNKLCAFSAPRG